MKCLIFIVVLILIIILVIPFEKFTFMKKNDTVYSNAYDLGENYLKIIKENNYFSLDNPAVMFDIDGTLIDLNGKPIKPIIKLLNKCIQQNIIVIIITARLDVYRDYTIKQLADQKINYSLLYLRSPKDDVNTFKSKLKKRLLEENDITTLMSLGDNNIDVDGEYSGYYIKLPNEHDPNLYHLNINGVREIIKD